MKTLLSIFALFLLFSCSIQKQTLETRYLTLNEIKRDYQLSNKQCRQIEKTDSIKSKWFQDFRAYDADEDYSIFKK
jgi:outer membrane biogenesis lipoprotein LolB